MSFEDQKIVVKGRSSLNRSNVVWQICCQCKDVSTSWEKLLDIKGYYRVQVAEYAVAQGIHHEPEFNW